MVGGARGRFSAVGILWVMVVGGQGPYGGVGFHTTLMNTGLTHNIPRKSPRFDAQQAFRPNFLLLNVSHQCSDSM